MGFLTPLTALLAAAIAIPALVSLYFLKLRRKKVAVPTTLLWQRAVHDLQVNAPFQKIRNSWMLWLQLLLLLLLLLVMARPTLNAVAVPGQRTVIVIDRSASMNANDTPDGQTRLEAAKETALRIVDDLEDGLAGVEETGRSGAMVIAFGERATTVQGFTNDAGKLRAAIRAIGPTDQASRFASAMALVEPHTRTAEGSDATVVHVLGDGRHHMGNQPPALGNADVRFTRFGGGGEAEPEPFADNLALVALSARRGLEQPERVQVYARLANYSGEPITASVSLSLDGVAASGGVQSVTVPAAGVAEADGSPGDAGSAQVQFEFVSGDDALIEVRHDHGDLLPADDVAALVLAPARRLRVLVVTPGNGYLIAGVRAARPRGLVTMTPAQYDQQDPTTLARGGWDDGGSADANAGFDVVIFDGHTPAAVPPLPSISFGAVPPIEGLAVRPSPEGAPPAEYLLQWRRDDPLLRSVELSDVVMRRPGRLVLPSAAAGAAGQMDIETTVLATATAGPVMAEVIVDGTRHVVSSFDILNTDWPLFISFPTFFQNALSSLGLGGITDEAGIAYRTGDNARVPAAAFGGGATGVRYLGPVELEATLGGGGVEGGAAVLPAFPAVGLYRAESDDAEPPYAVLAVNLLDPVESDLRAAGTITVGSVPVEGRTDEVAVRREVWPWLAWGALALLLVEWGLYLWRMRV